MKKYSKILFLILCLVIPSFIKADEVVKEVAGFNFITGDEVVLDKVVDGSSMTAGNIVNNNGIVAGIDINFGNNINYKGNSDYVFLAGNSLVLEGVIKNDGFIFGNLITSNNLDVKRDLFIFGTSVVLNGKIGRDVTIYANDVTLKDVVIEGDLTVYGSIIDVEESAIINGTLSYNKDIQANVSSLQIGSINELEEINNEISFKEQVISFIINYGGMLVIFLVLSFVVPKLFNRIQEQTENLNISKAISYIGYGALSLILVPIIIILLLTVSIGMPLSLLLLAIYIIVICLANIFSGYLYGCLIWKYLIKKEENILLIGLIGITISMFLPIIPFIGGLISIINLLIGVGIVLKLFIRK